uniref:Uncharacterized protein n=1 Tax=Syphacia muris TaxID=451379 RepID=A0A0N5AFB6_9BILA
MYKSGMFEVVLISCGVLFGICLLAVFGTYIFLKCLKQGYRSRLGDYGDTTVSEAFSYRRQTPPQITLANTASLSTFGGKG